MVCANLCRFGWVPLALHIPPGNVAVLSLLGPRAMLQVAVLVVLVTSNIPDEGLGQRMPVLINCIPPTASTTVATLATLVVGPRVVASCATAVDEAAGTIMVITRTPAVVLESNIVPMLIQQAFFAMLFANKELLD